MDACCVSAVQTVRTKTRQRTAKSCGPGAATVASIHAAPWWRGNGDKNRRSPGRARISRKTIARGKPGCPGCTCGSTRVLFATGLSHTGLRAQSAPGFPCALIKEEGQRDANTQAKSRRENENVCSMSRGKRSGRHPGSMNRTPFCEGSCPARSTPKLCCLWVPSLAARSQGRQHMRRR